MEEHLGSTADARRNAPPSWWGEPTFGQRFLAAVLDSVLALGLATLLLQLPVGVATERALMAATTALYLILATTLTGQTVGKRLLRIRVVDLETGGLPSLRAAVLRWLVPAAPAILGWLSPTVATSVSWFAFVVYVPVLRGPQHRGVHDHLAGTIVTRVATTVVA